MSAHPLSPEWTDDDVTNFVAGCFRNQVHPLHVLACMMNESGAYPETRNPGGRHPSPADLARRAVAVGLIQFTHAFLGENADLDAFRARPVAGQLPEVERFFRPYRGQLTTVELVYCAMFIPKWIARNPTSDTVICGSRKGDPYPQWYPPNKSLDVGGKGYITLDDLRVRASTRTQGPRWAELAGRVMSAMQDSPTTPDLTSSTDDPPLFVPDTLGHENDPPPTDPEDDA